MGGSGQQQAGQNYMSIKDGPWKAEIEQKLSSGEADTREEAHRLVRAEKFAEYRQQEEKRQEAALASMVEQGTAGSLEGARAFVDAQERAARIATELSGRVPAAMLELQSNLDLVGAAADIEREVAKKIASQASTNQQIFKMPPIPVSPVPGLVKESVSVTKALVHEIENQGEQNRERVRAVESAINEVRDEQREQGKKTRKLRKILWIWGTIVSVLIAFSSSSALARLWGWLTGLLAGG